MLKKIKANENNTVVKVELDLEYKAEIVKNKFYISLKHAKMQDDVTILYRLIRNDSVMEEQQDATEAIEFTLKQSGVYLVEIEIMLHVNCSKYIFMTKAFEFKQELSPEDKKSIQDKREDVLDMLNEVTALDYMIVDYFLNNGHDEIFVYFEEEESKLARILCYLLELNKNIRVRRYISNKEFLFTLNKSALMVRSTIKVHDVKDINLPPKYPILYIKMDSPGLIDEMLVSLSNRNKNLKIKKIEDVVNEMFWNAGFAIPVLNLIKKNPGLRVVLSKMPVIENEKGFVLSENEKLFTPENSRGVILRNLKETPPILTTNSFEGLDYSLEQLTELLEVREQYYDTEGVLKLEGYVGEQGCVNISAGIRVTTNQPQYSDNNIYIMGDCRYFGTGQPDDGTIASNLQKLINEQGISNSFKVFNYGYFLFAHNYDFAKIIHSIPFKDGDILILDRLSSPDSCLSELPYADMTDIFKRPHDYGEVYYELTHHTERATPVMAKYIFDTLMDVDYLNSLNANTDMSKYAMKAKNRKDELELSPEYERELTAYKNMLLKAKVPATRKSGAIVMNCNPFTLGHRYLIECSAAKVDILYIFVVEEDKSFFPYSDRMDLVKKGIADLDNVVVLPSGKFIISSLTFTDYFGKQERQNRVIDPSFDIALFAKHIAPTLNIAIRFVGEEPLDKITLQYNQFMQSLLPQYGIEVDIIPRKEFGDKVISASRVRALLKEKNFDAISKIVPETTLKYLTKKF